MLNCALCDYTTKSKQCLSQHAMLSHDVGLVWHACDAAPGECDFQAKTVYRLQDHIRRMHARVYAQRRKEQEERVRRALLDAGWQEHRLAEAMPPVGFFRREKRVDFRCAKLESRDTYARIDFVLGVPNGFVFLEVDENQHRYGYGAELSCDMKRMACVMESLAVETNYDTPPIYWLRYNPHAWRVGGVLRRVPKADREARLVAWLETVRVRRALWHRLRLLRLRGAGGGGRGGRGGRARRARRARQWGIQSSIRRGGGKSDGPCPRVR